MTYSVRQIHTGGEWDDFLLKQPFSLFIQSWKNGEFHRALGENFWVFGVYADGGELVAGSLVISVHAKRGNFLFLPYGPIISGHKEKKIIFKVFFQALEQFAKKEHYDFIRVSPFFERHDSMLSLFQIFGFHPAPMHILAEHTWILDISPPPEILFSQMKKNHRNLIHRCEKEGVRVEETQASAALERLNDMTDVIEKRHKFHRFSRQFIDTEFFTFATDNEAVIFEARLPDGRVDSSAIVLFFGNMACYRHSASLQQDKRLPTPYLVQWHVIQEAQRRGMAWYNFWGIAPSGASARHPFFGITHFKKGFGGEQKDLIPCQDLPLSPRYWLNWVIETCRKKKRGFS
ncbi:MAG TPA: hypothetical protein DCY48_01970 [Candidatus Magasanikbacteria bacterium]|nr:MAG: hypothetical protein A3I74_00880 [Candidatus Magasanikbacteria bacterium RIFCSPLOWO2_02_FULL_47_16]OGH80000.1 MAG: hypothetical protein A3C10_02345 [Candidatus Magasanikbacteria bacterium RIFCSPHIGHO2_02_FULL_48_18]HAZ28523.1 hypothetical protein [Candidatus Magasanikbacteria bacterium]